MIESTKGIVFQTKKYSETSLIATIYTEKFGIQRYMMKGVRGKKTKGKANLLQPLYLLDMEVYHSPKKELQSVKEYRMNYAFHSLPFDLMKTTQAIFLGEFLYKTLKEEEARPDLFQFLSQSIQVLDILDEGVGNFHLLFLTQLTRFMGIMPTSTLKDGENWFDLHTGSFTNEEPLHRSFLNSKHSEVLLRLQNIRFEDLSQIKLTSLDREAIIDHLIQFYEIHLGFSIRLNSLDVFKEVFHH